MRNRRIFVAMIGAVALVAAGCGDDDDSTGAADQPGTQTTVGGALNSLGASEGEVNVIAWAKYVEDGTNDPAVDWIKVFEQESGCDVSVKVAASSDEMAALVRTGEYDGLSASGDVALGLIRGGDVAPVNLDLIPNYADVVPGLKDRPHNTVGGRHYGVPHSRGANVLMYRTDQVTPPPDTWEVVLDPKSPYAGKVTAYDSPMSIADAAIFIAATNPVFKITDPYELDEDQFKAAVDLLKQQRTIIGEYWSDPAEEQADFTAGNAVLGTTRPAIANRLLSEAVPIATVLPKEGSTGWSDTWMVATKAKHPNCMYRFMNHIISPEANAKAAQYIGEAPANANACALTADLEHCNKLSATDEAYFDQVSYWKTPMKDCGDSRGEVCKDYSDWQKAWTEIKG